MTEQDLEPIFALLRANLDGLGLMESEEQLAQALKRAVRQNPPLVEPSIVRALREIEDAKKREAIGYRKFAPFWEELKASLGKLHEAVEVLQQAQKQAVVAAQMN